MATKSAAPNRRGNLAKDLYGAAERGLGAVYRDPERGDTRTYATLAAIVENLAPKIWHRDRPGALISVVDRAVGLLPSEDAPEFMSLSWRDVGKTICGLRVDPDDLQDEGRAGYNRRYQALEKAVDHRDPKNYLKRHVVGMGLDAKDSIWPRLADILLELERAALARAALNEARSKAAPRSIFRNTLMEQVREIVNRGTDLVLLYGDAGTGKSTLARDVAENLVGPADLVVINAGSESRLVEDLTDYLHMAGAQSIPGQQVLLMRAFAYSLSGGTTPQVVVIDGAEYWETIESLLPRSHGPAQPTIIVTGRVNLFPDGIGEVVHVQNMTSAEAIRMVVDRLAVAEDDARLLADELDGRPLALEHACSILKSDRGPKSIQALCEMLRADVVGTLDLASADAKLGTIYRRLLEQIRADAERSPTARLLDLLICLGPSVSHENLRSVWMTASGTDDQAGSDDARGRIAYLSLKKSLDELGDLALIRLTKRAESQDAEAFDYEMHALTHRLMRSLSPESLEPAALHTFNAVTRQLRDAGWQTGVPVPHDWTHWLPSLRAAFDALDKSNAARVIGDHSLAYIMAFIVRCRRQNGEGKEHFGAWCPTCDYDAFATHDSANVGGLAIELLSSGQLDGQPDDVERKIMADVSEPQIHDCRMGSPWLPPQLIYGIGSTVATISDSSWAALLRRSIEGTEAVRYQMLGSLFAGNCEWVLAESCFEASYAATATQRDIWSRAFLTETGLRAITAGLKAGRVPGHWLERLSGLMDSAEQWAGVPLDDLQLGNRIRLMASAIHLANIYWRGPDDNTDADARTVVAQNYDLLAMYARNTNQPFARWTIYYPLLYDLGRAHALVDLSEAERIFTDLLETLHGKQPRMCAILHLALLKIDATRAVGDAQALAQHVQMAQNLPFTHPEVSYVPYWKADFSLSTWALAQLAGCDEELLSELRLDASARAQVIGRPDRFAMAERVASGELSPVWLFMD